jgi:hypothetical protein
MEKSTLQELAKRVQIKAIQRGLVIIPKEKNKAKIMRFKNALKLISRNI